MKKHFRIITTFALVTQFLRAGSDGTLIYKRKTEVKDCFEKSIKLFLQSIKDLDKVLFRPIATGYRLMPSPVRTGTSNALNNLSNLVTVPNNLLQGEFKSSR